MCRNIRPLFNFDPPVTDDEIRAASLQFVRKISGFHKPSKANEAAFLAAVDEIAGVSYRLLRTLETTSAPRNREIEADKLLDDEELIEPVYDAQSRRHEHSRTRGRSQTPAEIALRLLRSGSWRKSAI